MKVWRKSGENPDSHYHRMNPARFFSSSTSNIQTKILPHILKNVDLNDAGPEVELFLSVLNQIYDHGFKSTVLEEWAKQKIGLFKTFNLWLRDDWDQIAHEPLHAAMLHRTAELQKEIDIFNRQKLQISTSTEDKSPSKQESPSKRKKSNSRNLEESAVKIQKSLEEGSQRAPFLASRPSSPQKTLENMDPNAITGPSGFLQISDRTISHTSDHIENATAITNYTPNVSQPLPHLLCVFTLIILSLCAFVFHRFRSLRSVVTSNRLK